MHINRICVCAVLLGAVFCLPALPQGERGTITGTVTDTSSAVIPGTNVSLRNVATNITMRAVSNDAGIYTFPALSPGTYEATFEKEGFRSRRVANIPLSTGLTATIDAVLEVGAVTEAVQVQASAVQLEVQTSGLSGTVESRRVVELPLLGRNPLQLSSLAPGVIPSSGQANNAGAVGSATNSRISGGLAMQNAVLMDGGESRGFTSGGQAYSVPIESVTEFKVETATYSAEFGRAGGGVVNVASKSGTNDYHGVAYWFLRNSALNANSWSNNRNRVARQQFQDNRAGGAVGGRIIRDRTFFFVNYEAIRSGNPDTVLATVPTDQQKAGDFSQTLDAQGRLVGVYDYLTTRRLPDGSLMRDPFPNNRIPAQRIHSISQNMLSYWPTPNRAGEGPSGLRNYFLAGKRRPQVDIWFARIDHQLSAKHRLFGRTGGSQNTSESDIAQFAFPARTINSNPTRTGLISLTSTFSTNLLGEARISYTRLGSNNYPVSEGFELASLGFPQSLSDAVTYRQFPQIAIQQYNSGSGLTVATFNAPELDGLGGATKTFTPQDTYHGQYHLTWIRGKHKLKMGYDMQRMKMTAFNSQFSAGQYFFDRVYSQGPDPGRTAINSGHGFASFLLGVPQAGTITSTPWMGLFQRYYAGYIQDDWRVTRRLTLNLGFRYEYISPYGEKYGAIGYLDPDGTEPITGGKGVFRWVPPGGYHTEPNYKTFGPRVGLAFQLNSKTVIRTAGAIFNAANNGLNAAASDFGSGLFTSNFLTLGPDNPLPYTPPAGGSWSNPFAGGLVFPERGVTTFAGQNIRVDYQKHPLAYLSNWTFGIQREVSPTMIAEVSYVGSKITHLFWNRMDNGNDPLLLEQWGERLLDVVPNPYYGVIQNGALSFPTVQRRQLLRPYPHYQQVLAIRVPYGDGNYQSMTARFEKRYSHNMTLSVAYTLSKSIASTAESNTWVVGPSNAYYDPKYNRSIEANDTPHRLVISHVYDFPFGKGKRWLTQGFLSKIVGGWQWNGITILQTGRPILITAPDNTNLYDFSYTNGRADRLRSGVLPAGQTKDQWFDTSSFQTAARFTVPTDSLSQPDLRGPGRRNFDMSIFKNTYIGERYNVQFRAEFFNITNSPFFEARGATTNVTSQDFGRILSGGNPRQVQFGIRILF